MELGNIVMSKKGRDAKKSFMVVAIANENYVLIANGKEHTVEKPKLKNVKHLRVTCENIETVELTNKKLKAFISKINNLEEK